MRSISTTILFIFCLPLFIQAQNDHTALEKKFVETVTNARQRINTLQSNGELSKVQYEEEEEKVRDAEQLVKLIEANHQVSTEAMKSWIPKLDRLGVSQEKEAEGVQYSDKKKKAPTNQNIDHLKDFEDKLSLTKSKLQQQLNNGEITTPQHVERLEQVNQIEREFKNMQAQNKVSKKSLDALNKKLQEVLAAN